MTELITIPFALALGAESVSATLNSDAAREAWNVTVVISRQPDQPRVDASEVDARLVDGRGEAMAVIERPKGALPEASTSLSSSVNAVFRFRSCQSLPTRLVVTFRGASADFAVAPKPQDR